MRVHQASLELSRMLNETITERKRATAERDEWEASAKHLRRARDVVESSAPLTSALGHLRGQRKVVVQAVMAACSCFVLLALVWCCHAFAVGRPRDISNEFPQDIHGTGPFDTGASRASKKGSQTAGPSSTRTMPATDLFSPPKQREPKSFCTKVQRIPRRLLKKFENKLETEFPAVHARWAYVSCCCCHLCSNCDSSKLMLFWVILGTWVVGLVVFWHFEILQPVLAQAVVFLFLMSFVGGFAFIILTEMYGSIGGIFGDIYKQVELFEEKVEKFLKMRSAFGL